MAHSTGQNQRIKIEAITSLKSDFIFLSDTRLGNKNLTTSRGEIANMFLVNNNRSYNMCANSTKNKRGVGILYATDLDLIIEDTITDDDENLILLKVKLNNIPLIIGSIYGPNEHDPDFFRTLYTSITILAYNNIILGGDFNCTPSPENIATNPDCANMQNIPNYRHSMYVNELCDALDLVDPFRLLWPDKKKFSYKPFGQIRKNRSRIDFFLLSNTLTAQLSSCDIADYSLSTSFDHYPIHLSLHNAIRARRGPKKLQISNHVLKDPVPNLIVP
jgi:exonuclease III